MHLTCCFIHSAWVNSDNTRQIFDLTLAQEWGEEEKKEKRREQLFRLDVCRGIIGGRGAIIERNSNDRPNDQLKRPLCLLRQTRQENNLSG